MASRLRPYLNKLGFKDGLKYYKLLKSRKPGQIQLKGYDHPIKLRGILADNNMFEQIFIDKQYDIEFKESPQIIFDLGANIGLASIYFSNMFPAAKIVALEPELANYNAAIANLTPFTNVTLLHGAIWDKEESIIVTDQGHGEAAFMIAAGTGANETKAYTIKGLMDSYKVDVIDLLKVDIEGAEKEIFETGSEDWIPKCKMIIVETHDRYRKGTSKAVFSAIGKYDFSLELSGENMILYNNHFFK